MSDRNSKTSLNATGAGGPVGKPRHGLRLIKTTPEDIVAQITAGGTAGADEKKSASIVKARGNPLVKQLTSLADALDAEVAMILKM